MAIPTKIEKLNNLLFGGFPEGSYVLVQYDEAPLARAFILSLAALPSVCITTDAQPKDIGDGPKYIDAYSAERGLKTRPQDRVVRTSAAINDISLDLSEELRSSDYKMVIVFSITTLLKKNPKDAVYSFIDVFGSRLKEKGAVLVLFANEAETDARDMERLQASSDIVLKLQKGERGPELVSNAFPLPLQLKMFSGYVDVR